MKAEILTICVPNNGCDQNCPFCISKMTPEVEPNFGRMYRNIEKVKTLARAAHVSHVLFTSKGEPTMNEDLYRLSQEFEDFPMELQTNGYLFQQPKGRNNIEKLYAFGFDTIAVSINSLKQLESFADSFDECYKKSLHIRLTINLLPHLVHEVLVDGIAGIISYAHKHNISQVTFRKIMVAENCTNRTAQYIHEKVYPFYATSQYQEFQHQYQSIIEQARLVRTLAWDNAIYDYKGIGFLHSDYCIQERSNNEDVRSLIFNQDGHVYTSWNSKATILF